MKNISAGRSASKLAGYTEAHVGARAEKSEALII